MAVCLLQTNEGYAQKDFRRIEGIEIIATNCIVIFVEKQFSRSGSRASLSPSFRLFLLTPQRVQNAAKIVDWVPVGS